MEKIKTTLMIIFVVSISAQIDLDIIVSDFKVSLGIIFLGVYLYLHRNLNNVTIGLASGFVVFILRVIIDFLTDGNFSTAVISYYPEIFFYTIYAAMFTFLIKAHHGYRLRNFFWIVLFSDFTANLIELYLRVNTELFTSRLDSLFLILFVAIIRSVAVSLSILAFRYYRNILMKEEHEQRYQNLLLLSSQLKAEMYWADKSMNHIENVMRDTYNLHSKISLDKEYPCLSDDVMNIAREIHEIKKEVGLIVRGVEEITNKGDFNQELYLSDILSILKSTLKREIETKNIDVEILTRTYADFMITDHFYVMSILRNLAYNSFDAVKEKGYININHYKTTEYHVFEVSDNGSGIKSEDLSMVFTHGFSTKIDYDTGNINRGIGLSLVKDLVEKHFDGVITVTSIPFKETKFEIRIPLSKMKEVK
jgi:two-component system sensor histidine kinase YcbA